MVLESGLLMLLLLSGALPPLTKAAVRPAEPVSVLLKSDTGAVALPGEPQYYLIADVNTPLVAPDEELRRQQRSLLKKLWKDIGLEDLFLDNGPCVNCCDNNYSNSDYSDYNSGGGESPPYDPLYTPFQPFPPLTPLRPLNILRPLISRLPGIGLGGNRGGYGAPPPNYNAQSPPPPIYEVPPSPVPTPSYGVPPSPAPSPSYEVPPLPSPPSTSYENNISPVSSEGYENANESPAQPSYELPNAAPVYDEPAVPLPSSPPVPAPVVYDNAPALPQTLTYNGAAGSSASNRGDSPPQIVYQPIIYVSPQYQSPSDDKVYKAEQQQLSYEAPAAQHQSAYEIPAPVYDASPSISPVGNSRAYSAAASPITSVAPAPLFPCYTSPQCVCPPQYSSSLGGWYDNDLRGLAGLPAFYTVVAPSPRDDGKPLVTAAVPSSADDSSYAPPQLSTPPSASHYQPSIAMTLDDQPYRECPELFVEYNRKLRLARLATQSRSH